MADDPNKSRAPTSLTRAETPLRVLTESLGRPRPPSMAEYLAAGGSAALGRALSLSPGAVLDLIAASGIVCRDGRGPAGDLMRRAASARAPIVVCQAHRPMAPVFDRLVLEECPHGVIEGMAIAAYAIGAATGCVCVWADLGSAVARALIALDECTKMDLVGDSVLGAEFDLSLAVRKMQGPAAASEELVLASLNSCPASAFVSSPETFLHLRALVHQGPEAFSAWGLNRECGTKLVTLRGEAGETIEELPLGTDLVSWARGKAPAAVVRALQVGHPLGRLVQPSAGPLPLDAALLAEAGPSVDAGCLVAFGPKTCMIQVVSGALEAAREGTEGEARPCVIAFDHISRLLDRMQRGEAPAKSVEQLDALAAGVLDMGPSAVGRAWARCLGSALEQFRPEFERHASQRRCAAATCECVTEAPCAHACPIGINVPQFIGLISKKSERRAADLIRRRNPLPSVCGRMCHRPCEELCVLSDGGQPIAIRELERTAADADKRKRPPRVQWRGKSGKKVVVVGAGPAGLSAAFALSAWGHDVVIYDREPAFGGLLASTVPAYVISLESLERDVMRIRRRVRARLASAIDTKQRLAQLLRRADAALLAVGMSLPAPSAIPGSNAKGVVQGLGYLSEYRHAGAASHGHVVVIGRGIVAAHAARCAARSGAKSVTWLRLERHVLQALTSPRADDLDSSSDELAAVVADGVRLVLSPTEVEIAAEAHRVAAVGWLGVGGREQHPSQRVVLAMGRIPDTPFLPHKAVELAEDGRVAADPSTGITGAANVFAAGECAHGPMRVADAIASGVRTAQHMDRYLGGTGELPANVDPGFMEDEMVQRRLPTIVGERVDLPVDSVGSDGHCEVRASLPADLARRESSRCRRCRIFA